MSSFSNGERLITRLTVFLDTPAARATSIQGFSPRNAAEALTGPFEWNFETPDSTGVVTFLLGGEIRKSWNQDSPWKWEALSTRGFRLIELTGKQRSTALTLDEKFTRFHGPGFANGKTYQGSRIDPSARAR